MAHRPIPTLTPRQLERFKRSYVVDPDTGCWHFQTLQSKKRGCNYGTFSAGAQNLKAHRVAYFVFHGVDPGELMVCHTCDNPPCVNPDHLFLGTARDNCHDAISKGRLYQPPRAIANPIVDGVRVCARCGHRRVDDRPKEPRCRNCERQRKRRAYEARREAMRHVPRPKELAEVLRDAVNFIQLQEREWRNVGTAADRLRAEACRQKSAEIYAVYARLTLREIPMEKAA